MPKPSQVGQAPAGLLNENIRGSSSGKEYPQCGQAKLAEKTSSSALLSSILATTTIPPESSSAVSNDSAKRLDNSGRILKRSTITSMVCFFCNSSCGGSERSQISPRSEERRVGKECRSRSWGYGE